MHSNTIDIVPFWTRSHQEIRCIHAESTICHSARTREETIAKSQNEHHRGSTQVSLPTPKIIFAVDLFFHQVNPVSLTKRQIDTENDVEAYLLDRRPPKPGQRRPAEAFEAPSNDTERERILVFACPLVRGAFLYRLDDVETLMQGSSVMDVKD